METKIKIRPSELNEKLLNKILEFIGDNEDIDIEISLRDSQENYNELLSQSIESAEKGDHLVSFTMEEFMTYKPASKTGK